MVVDVSDSTGDANGTSKRQTVVDFLKNDLRVISGTTDTLVITDANAFIKCNNTGGSLTITVPPNSSVGFEIGSTIKFWRNHTNTVTFAAGTGVVVASKGSALDISPRYGVVSITKIATNGWLLYGDLA
tara:strand:- start:2108 stop:2494 length:387 start_codon:yes stop_codon:yes gene_type:complete